MREAKVASRYAKSLLQLALEKGELEAVNEDMRLIRTVVRENKDLSLMINSPVIKADKKGSIFKAIFGGKVSKMSMDFIDILVRKRREYLVDDMAEAFDLQYKLHKGTVTAEVTTATALNEEQRAKVMTIVKSMGVAQSVEIEEKVDPSIIGGIIVRVGDQQIDQSVQRKLQDYRKEFSKNQYVADL